MPGIYGQLQAASLEVLATDPASNTQGRFHYNSTSSKMILDDGTLKRAMLRNDQNCVFGNNATAANNIRLNRAANSVLQLVTGGDTTAEGTLSTALAQFSARQENYTTVGRPAAGNAGRMYFDSTVSLMYVDNGTTWVPVGAGGAYSVGTLQTLTAGGTITALTTPDKARQLYPVVGTSGQTAMASAPLGNLASVPDGFEFTFVGTDDANTVLISTNGLGAALSAGVVLGPQAQYELGLGMSLCMVKMTISSTAVLVVQ